MIERDSLIKNYNKSNNELNFIILSERKNFQ